MFGNVNFTAARIVVRNRLRVWLQNRRGNVAMMFGLMAIPLVVLLGFGIDYYKGLSDKTRLDAAADAAALAAIAAAQQYYLSNPLNEGVTQLIQDAQAVGIAQGVKAFNANAATTELVTSPNPQVSFKPNAGAQTFTAMVTYSAQTPTTFGGIVGVNMLNINGAATSSVTFGTYLDFYVVLDVSGSMGLPTTADGQAALIKINPDNGSNGYHPYKYYAPPQSSDGCAFACHQGADQGYATAKNPPNGAAPIELRVDSVGNAVAALLSTAESDLTIPNQFRIGLYPFIVHPIAAAQLSANYGQHSTTQKVATNLGLYYLDTGGIGSYQNETTNPPNPFSAAVPPKPANPNIIGYDGTHFENIWPDMNKYYLGPPGNGATAATPKPFIFLVTDGMDNNQLSFAEAGKSGNGTTGSQPLSPDFTAYPQPYYSTPLTPSPTATAADKTALKSAYSYSNLPTPHYGASGFQSACTAAKTAGYTIAVLYIPYIMMPYEETKYNAEDYQVNNVLAGVPTASSSTPQTNSTVLQNCASLGFFFTANSPEDIKSAMQAMFNQSLHAARLTQ